MSKDLKVEDNSNNTKPDSKEVFSFKINKLILAIAESYCKSSNVKWGEGGAPVALLAYGFQQLYKFKKENQDIKDFSGPCLVIAAEDDLSVRYSSKNKQSGDELHQVSSKNLDEAATKLVKVYLNELPVFAKTWVFHDYECEDGNQGDKTFDLSELNHIDKHKINNRVLGSILGVMLFPFFSIDQREFVIPNERKFDCEFTLQFLSMFIKDKASLNSGVYTQHSVHIKLKNGKVAIKSKQQKLRNDASMELSIDNIVSSDLGFKINPTIQVSNPSLSLG